MSDGRYLDRATAPYSQVIRVNGHDVSLQSGANHVALSIRQPTARPFLKWAGGKQWLAPLAHHLIPRNFRGRYYEPFVGGGAMFLAARPGRARIGDANTDLMRTYEAIAHDASGVIDLLRRYPHNRTFFEQIRRKKTRVERTTAARFIYLNKTAFNGLYRVNMRGEFNVPFGRFRNPTICPEERLHQAASLLETIELYTGDFESCVAPATSGDFVFFDPPYITGHTNNGFLKYNAALFSWNDQIRLARLAKRLRDAGVNVVVTNAAFPPVLALYPDFCAYLVQRRTRIGGPSKARGWVNEVVLSSRPLFSQSDAKACDEC